MPKNRVRFQPGKSLRDFLNRYGTDDQCTQTLSQARWPQGFRCPRCGYPKHRQLRRRAVQCIHCKPSLPAGTVFENTKLGLSTSVAGGCRREGPRSDGEELGCHKPGISQVLDGTIGG